MEPNPHTALPLEAFFARLEAAGFRMDTARKMRLLRVLEEEAPELYGDFGGLKYRLGPFVARTPQEQERFYDFFDQFLKECASEAEALNKLPEASTVPIPPIPPVPKFNQWWLLLLLPVLGLLYWWFQPTPRPVEPCRVQMELESVAPLREGDLLECRNISTCPDSSAYVWEIRDAASGQLEYTDTAFHLNWKTVGDGKDKLVVLRYTAPAADIANATDSLIVRFEENVQNIGGKPYLQTFAVRRDYPRQLLQLNGWYWLFAIVPLFFAGWLLARWWKKRHEKTPEKTVTDLEAEYPIHDAGPYFVPYLPQDAKITVPRDFFRMAEVMRRRETGIRRYFDAAASVRATVDAGGYPEWREKSDTRPAEYLFLVQRSDERNQQGQLFERLTSFLKRREAPAEVFFHSGSFDVFKNPEHPQGLNLAELKQHYSMHRLVLLGDGHGLVNPYNPQTPALLTAPVKILSSWPRRILLTPEPVSGWSFQEALLHRHFLICPADTDGMLAGLEMLDRMEEYEPGNFARREAELLRLHPQISHRYRHWETPEDHKAYLKDHPEWYRWLCALAVCVQPDWALTIAVGRAIGVEVTHDGLLALSRIPWLNSNAPDTNLRLALLRQLDSADEALARKAVAEELEHVKGRMAGSFAKTDWTTNLAIQRFALDPRDEGNKETLRDLKRLGLLSGAQLAELDLIVQEKIDKKGLPAHSTDGIKAWLEQPAPKPFWTRELLGGMAAMFLSAFLLAYGFYYNRTRAAQPFETGIKTPAGFWMTLKQQDDQAIELNNQAVGLWEGFDRLKLGNDTSLLVLQSFYRLIDSNAVDTMKVFHSKGLHNIALLKMAADTFLGLAISLRVSSFYSLADSNRTSLLFNFTTEQFRFFLDSLQQQAVAIKKGEQNVLKKKPTKEASVPPANPLNELEEIRNAYAKLAKPSTWYSYGSTAYNERSPLCLAARHGQGLCDFYLDRRDSAMAAYNRLLVLSGNQYFDTLNMPVNLRTLLDINPIVPVDKKPEPLPKSKAAISKSKPKTKPKIPPRVPEDKLVLPSEKQPEEPEIPQFARAIKNGDRQCPEGSSYEEVDGGTCWSCPPGYQRTKSRVNEAAACVRAGTTEYSKATNHGNGSGKEGRECGPAQFWDAYNKGTCWSCPDGFSRTRSADITSERACERVIREESSRARMISNAACPDGNLYDADAGSCWRCPPNYIRTIYPVDGDQACELNRIKKN
ncbi:MAG: hypothetical protein ACKV1O_00075 [Saprospiraceae bacterium]